jgi:hypothetical protein
MPTRSGLPPRRWTTSGRLPTAQYQHRPHRSLHGAAPLKPLPKPVDLKKYGVLGHTRIGAPTINEYRLVA